MGRYTLKELSQLRQDRADEREVEMELMAAKIRVQRDEHSAEREFLARFEHHHQMDYNVEIRHEGLTRADLYAQCEAQYMMREELRQTRWAQSEEVAAERSSLHGSAREKARHEDSMQRSRAELAALHAQFLSEKRGTQAAENRIDAISRAIVVERERTSEEADYARRQTRLSIKEEAAVERIISETSMCTVHSERALRLVRDEVLANERDAAQQRLLMEAHCARQESELRAFETRSMAQRYSEASAARSEDSGSGKTGHEASMERLMAMLP
eukprot:TRINITY_DN16135_c0_g1_i1.p1 TRINITY_DN16135_c0_g1~~TRINITY_DN16135_c0_g1_i1.p1  ORF type:complete len:272 (-),score=59.03 TRINITY_DN16135_c0_g1_i1:35-850(-)